MQITDNSKQIQSHAFNTKHTGFTWFTPRMGVTSTELCFSIIAQGRVKHSSATPHMQLKISSLRSLLSSILLFYNTLFPPCRSLRIVTCMFFKPATGYRKIAIADNRTRARLLQQSNSLQNTTNKMTS